MIGRACGLWAVLCALAMSITFPSVDGSAESSRTLMQAYIDEQYLDMFVTGGFSTQDLSVKAANKAAKVTESGLLSETDVTVRTTVLLDISTSMPVPARDKIHEFIENEIKNLAKNEEIKIVTFGEKINVLRDFTSDRYDLSNTAKEIDFTETQSAVYDAIYNTMPEIGAENGKPCFYRTVVITDGADYAVQGVTREELYMRLRAETYPIDVICVCPKAPENSNKELSALSRISSGRYVDIYPESDVEKCASGISAGDFFWIRAEVPIELLDGSTRQIDVSDGSNTLTFDLKLSTVNAPVEEVSQTKQPEPEISSSSSLTETSEEVSDDQDNKTRLVLGSTELIILIAAGAAVIIAVIALLAVTVKKKHASAPPVHDEQTGNVDDQNGATEFYNDYADERYTIKLSVHNNPNESWTLTITGDTLIGRAENCIVKLNDNSVSREQCKIIVESMGLAVVNLSKSNATKLNGMKLNDKAPLRSGDIIKFGRVSLRVDFIQRIGAEVPCYSNSSNASDSGNTESIF